MVTLCDKLNNTPSNTFRSVIEQYVDVDQALWYIACCNVVHNLDSYISGGHNYYMYFDPADGRMNMLIWDCNMSFGVFGGGSNAYRLSPLFGSGSTTRPLSGRLLADPEYREIYLAHVRTILDDCGHWDHQLAIANAAYQKLIRSAVQSDTNKLYPMSVFDSNVTTN